MDLEEPLGLTIHLCNRNEIFLLRQQIDNMLKERLIEEFRSLRYKLNTSHFKLIRLVFVVSIFISIPVTVYLAQKGFFKTTQAAVTATFSFSPNTFLLPSDKTVSLLLNSGASTIGFAQAEIKFDKAALRLVSYVVGSELTRVISATDVSSANQNGSFRLAVGLEPARFTLPPSGTFEVARLTFSKVTSTPNVSKIITQDVANSQVVTLRTEEAVISPASANAIINPQVACTSVALVDTTIIGASYDRVRVRLKNNSSQTVYLTGSRITWSSTTPLTVDWFSWGSNQYYAGDSSSSPTIYNPVTVLPLPPGATGSWTADFKNQPLGGIRGTFAGELTVNQSCSYTGRITR